MSDEQTIGRYRIVERIGRGGMGVLYKGIDVSLDREVAIKVMSNTFEGDVDHGARARFFREARAAAKLQHRNIVTVFEFAEEDGVPYIVMEFLRGRSLAARIGAAPPLTLEQVLDIVAQLCAGLQFAHEHGVVHRDVKPGNVWLLDDGTVKLLDFGIAKISSSTLTKTGDVMGSASYMAPEQVSGKPVDGRADVFSCGVVLYELLAGRTPFEAESPTATILKIVHEDPTPIASLVAGISTALSTSLDQALEKDPVKRYQRAGDFGADLQLVRMSLLGSGDTVFGGDLPLGESPPAPSGPATIATAGEVVIARPPAPDVAPRPAAPRRRHVLLAGAVAGALVVCTGSAWLIATRSARVPAGDPLSSKEPDRVGAPRPDQPAAPTAQRLLKIGSTPDSAAIELDGQDTGYLTPAEIPLSTILPRRIKLKKKGFQAAEQQLASADLDAGTVSIRLLADEPVTVRLRATGSYPFEITDGKRVLSALATSHDVFVPVPSSLRLRASPQLLDYAFRVDAAAGSTFQVKVPGLGGLTIRSAMETCQISANGHDLGFPPVNNQSVAAGTYDLQLSCPDGQKVRGSPVTVVAGETRIARIP
jgi:hypothetical protein